MRYDSNTKILELDFIGKELIKAETQKIYKVPSGLDKEQSMPAEILTENNDPLLEFAGKEVELYQEMLDRDSRIADDYEALQATIMSLPYTIQPGNKEQEAVDRSRFIEHNLKNLELPFGVSLDRLFDAVVYGFSVLEIVCEIDDYEGQKLWHLKKLKPILSKSINFELDDKGNLEQVVVNKFSDKEAILKNHKVVVGVYPDQFQDNQYYGRSKLIRLYEWYYLKRNVTQFLGKALELNVDPPTIARIGNQVLEVDRAKAKESIKMLKAFKVSLSGYSMQPTKGGMAPVPDMTLEKLETKTANEIWAYISSLIKDIDNIVSRTFSIPPDLTSNERGGSNARASVQYDYYFIMATKYQKWIERNINNQLIKLLEDINFDYNDLKTNGRSKMSFGEESKFSLETAKMLVELSKSGLLKFIPKEYIFNDMLYMPMQTEEEIIDDEIEDIDEETEEEKEDKDTKKVTDKEEETKEEEEIESDK